MDIKVLIVEDNPDHAETIQKVLEYSKDASYTCEWVTTVKAAVAWLKDKRNYAARENLVILLDLTLPDGQGTVVVERIKDAIKGNGNGSKIPIMVLTGWGGSEIATAAKEAGADAVLTKPADPNEISSGLMSIVIHNKLGREAHPIELTLARMGAIVWRLGEMIDRVAPEPVKPE